MSIFAFRASSVTTRLDKPELPSVSFMDTIYVSPKRLSPFSVSPFLLTHPLTTCLQLNIRKRINRYPICFVQYGNESIFKTKHEKKKPTTQFLTLPVLPRTRSVCHPIFKEWHIPSSWSYLKGVFV